MRICGWGAPCPIIYVVWQAAVCKRRPSQKVSQRLRFVVKRTAFGHNSPRAFLGRRFTIIYEDLRVAVALHVNLHGFLAVLLEIYRCLSAFLKVDPNGAYAVTATQRNLRGFLEFGPGGACFGDKNT